jgi:hypothetical protein
MLQKPINEKNIASVVHFQSHITEWIKQGKIINSTTNGTQQSIQASMASQTMAQNNTAPNAPITT